MKMKQSIFILEGLVDYDWVKVLGAYSTAAAAAVACEDFKAAGAAKSPAVVYYFDNYSITEHVLDAEAVAS